MQGVKLESPSFTAHSHFALSKASLPMSFPSFISLIVISAIRDAFPHQHVWYASFNMPIWACSMLLCLAQKNYMLVKWKIVSFFFIIHLISFLDVVSTFRLLPLTKGEYSLGCFSHLPGPSDRYLLSSCPWNTDLSCWREESRSLSCVFHLPLGYRRGSVLLASAPARRCTSGRSQRRRRRHWWRKNRYVSSEKETWKRKKILLDPVSDELAGKTDRHQK